MGKSKKEVKKDNKILYVICAVLIIIIISVIIFLLLNNRNVICENVSNQKADGYKIENTYNISSDKGIVNKVVIKEVITSEKTLFFNSAACGIEVSGLSGCRVEDMYNTSAAKLGGCG